MSLWTPGDDSPTKQQREIDEALKSLGETEGHEAGAEGRQIRLLRCTQCKTLEELPDYQGDPHNDVVLDELVERHRRRHPHDDAPANFLLRVSEEMWNNPAKKKAIHKQIWADLEKDKGFVPEYYDTKNTLHEDAVKCFERHSRSIPCIDWHAHDKRIGNPTKEGWREGRVKVYVCDFCPVAAKVMEMRNKELGRYE
jgi:hypothetical protein